MPTIEQTTKGEMREALARARVMLGTDHGAFARSARAEFYGAREHRDHLPRAADDLAKALARQPDQARGNNPHNDAVRLVALAEAINALACLQCNGVQRVQAAAYGGTYKGGSWNDQDERQQETTRREIVRAMNAVLVFYGSRVAHSYGDPRGHVVHIELADQSSNRGGIERVWGL